MLRAANLVSNTRSVSLSGQGEGERLPEEKTQAVGEPLEQRERARLWSLYFGACGLVDPPPFVEDFAAELRGYLEAGPVPVTAPLLRRVK